MSPNYPGHPGPAPGPHPHPGPHPGPPGPPGADTCTPAVAVNLKAGDALVMSDARSESVCECFTWEAAGHAAAQDARAPATSAQGRLALLSVPGHTLCMAPSATGSALVLANCGRGRSEHGTAHTADPTAFHLGHNNTAPKHAQPVNLTFLNRAPFF